MNGPLISIGLPVFNGGNILEQAIISITNQTYNNFELIISDNNSTDETQLICQNFAKQDSRIKYFKQEVNIGMLPNFNFLPEHSNGKYYMWAAADDKWDQNFLEQAVDILENNPDCVSVLSHFEIFDTKSGAIIEKITPSSIASNLPNLRIKRVLEELHPNLIYGLHRKSSIIDNKFETIDWSDVLFVSRLVSKGKYYIIPKVLYRIGINGSKRIPYSVTGKWLNLFKFYFKYLSLVASYSPSLLSLIKNCFFTFKITALSYIKVNFDIFKHSYYTGKNNGN